MALFGPEPAEREKQRLWVLEGHEGMAARNELVRSDQGRFIQPEPEPRLRNPWRPEPTPIPPPRPMHLHFAKPAKPFSQMSDDEIDEFAARFVRGMAEQVAHEPPTG
jgi:hypothetical protein